MESEPLPIMLGKKKLSVCQKGHEFLEDIPYTVIFNWFDKENNKQHREVPVCVICLADKLEAMNIGTKEIENV